MQAVATGVGALSLTESTLNPWATFGSQVNPTFLAGSVTVSSAVAVPLPSAAWLLVAGFSGLMGVGRQASKAVRNPSAISNLI